MKITKTKKTNLYSIFLSIQLHVLQVNSTVKKIFENGQIIDKKYSKLTGITAQIINQNAIELQSNYVATIGVNNDNYISNKVLSKVTKAAVSNPYYQIIQSLAKNVVVFGGNYSEISVDKDLNYIHRRGRFVICVTKLYENEVEFHEELIKTASHFWANRISRFIFISWVKNELNIFGIQAYDEKTCFPTKLIKIGTVKDGKVIKTSPFFKKLKNLNKCTLRVITTTGMPYVETYVKNNETRVKGIEGNILNILSERLNFTPIISDTENLLDFHSRFNDSKETLRFNMSDLCFSGKKIETDEIESTVSITDCNLVWIVPKAELIKPWMQLLIPFDKLLWITLAVTVLFFGMVTSLFFGNRISSLLNIWSLFLGVSIEMKNSGMMKNDLKIVLGSWIIFGYIITQSYLASLEGHRATPNFMRQINSVKELIASGIPIEGHRMVLRSFCLHNDTELMIKTEICSRYRTRSDAEIMEKIKEIGKLDMGFTMKKEIYRNSKFFRDYNTHAMEEILLRFPTAFLTQTGAPFLDEINVILTRLIETGFVDLWTKQNIVIQHEEKHYPEKLNLQHVFGVIPIAAFGYAFSIIVFGFEYSLNCVRFQMLAKVRKYTRIE